MNDTFKIGDRVVLIMKASKLNGCHAEIVISDIDADGPYFEVKLLDVPPQTSYRIGDTIACFRNEMRKQV